MRIVYRRGYEASTSQIADIPDAVTVHKFRTPKPKPTQNNINLMS